MNAEAFLGPAALRDYLRVAHRDEYGIPRARLSAGIIISTDPVALFSTVLATPPDPRSRGWRTRGVTMYEIYALKYGERTTTACQFFYREVSHEPITLHFYVWVILGGPYPVLVDAGALEADAASRGLRDYASPAALLAAFDTIEALAGSPRLVVAGHDPEVAARFTPVEPRVIRIA